ASLPARAPGRGDHGRGSLRRPVGCLGPGREPPARAEGPARAAAALVGVEGLADDHRDPPAGGVRPALVVVVAGVELRRQPPEALALLALGLPGAVVAAAAAGP